MLNKNTPAEFIAFKYLETDVSIRVHKHTDNNSIWFVLADLCEILNLSNVTYTASRLGRENIYKHKVLTDGGVQIVTWIKFDEAIKLCNQQNNSKLSNFLREIKVSIENKQKPIILEQSTYLKLLAIIDEINSQIVK